MVGHVGNGKSEQVCPDDFGAPHSSEERKRGWLGVGNNRPALDEVEMGS